MHWTKVALASEGLSLTTLKAKLSISGSNRTFALTVISPMQCDISFYMFAAVSNVDEMYGLTFKIFCLIIHNPSILIRTWHLLCVVCTSMCFFCVCVNPCNAKATFVQSARTQTFLETI